MKIQLTESKIKQLIRETIKDAIYNSHQKPKVRMEVKMPSGGITKSRELNLPEIANMYNQIPEEERVPSLNINFPIFHGVHAESKNDWEMLANVIMHFCDTKEDVENLLDKLLVFDNYMDNKGNKITMPFHVEATIKKGRKFKATDAGPEHDIEENVTFIKTNIFFDTESRQRLQQVGWPEGYIRLIIHDESDTSTVNFWEGN